MVVLWSGETLMAANPEAVTNQHQLIGIKQIQKGAFERNAHPDAQWFPEAGLGLFIHWGLSRMARS